MHELTRIADALTDAAARGETAVLATVVRVVGSAYRGVGARLVVREDGTTLGLVSGGCLEGDIAARAAAVRASGRATAVTYDTRSGDDLVWGLGLGCEGLVEVLLAADGSARGTSRDYATVDGSTAHVALEPIAPALSLVICGAGPDAAPVSRLALAMGWDVTVVDHRPASALHAARFPTARVLHCPE